MNNKPVEEQIRFLENKINDYIETIRSNPKGETCRLWIDWIKTWNDEIISLNIGARDNDNL